MGTHSLAGLRVYSLGVYSLGMYRARQPFLDLGTYSLDWEYTVSESRVWEFTELEQPILGLGRHLPVLTRRYSGPFSVNVV